MPRAFVDVTQLSKHSSQLSETLGCDWSHAAFAYVTQLTLSENLGYEQAHSAFTQVKLSKSTHNNQISRKGIVFSHYHICKFSAQIIECKIFAPYELNLTKYSQLATLILTFQIPLILLTTATLTPSSRSSTNLLAMLITIQVFQIKYFHISCMIHLLVYFWQI